MFGVSLTITGMRVCSLHQRVTISTYSGTWPTAEPMPRSLMPCGQPKLSSTAVGAGVLDLRQDRASSSPRRTAPSARRPCARSGQSRLTCLISLQVDVERPVGDQLDVVEAHHPRSSP